ncbi:MAG: replication restart helicase PriA [Anaerolineae bacterium]
MRYAEVAVNIPAYPYGRKKDISGESPTDVWDRLLRTFHYAIPGEWQDRLRPGQLVQVPFGKQPAQGIVVALADSAPVSETRYLTAILEEQPVVTPAQIALARWISREYLVPLFTALQLMLPPGLPQRARLRVRWTGPDELPPDLRPAERRLAELLQERGELSSEELSRHIPEKQWRRAAVSLATRGLVYAGVQLTPPRVRPVFDRMVWTQVSDPRRALLSSALGRDTAQARFLHALALSTDPLPELETLCANAGCSPQVARSLEQKGLIRILPAQTLVRPTPLEHLPENWESNLRSKPMAKGMQALLQRPEPAAPLPLEKACQLAGLTRPQLRRLAELGLVTIIEQPALVALAVGEAAVEEALLELKGVKKYLPALEFLVREGRPVWVGAVYAETGANAGIVRELAEAGLIQIEEQERWRDPLAQWAPTLDRPPRLTPDQERVWQEIEQALEAGRREVFLLHGVTGSGKTEIYLRALAKVLEAGRQAIVLVPEISLTPQTIRRFAARFPGRVTTLHSELSAGERYDQWRRIRDGEVDIVIGPRSAVFAPLPRLGIIIIDEEHEAAYKAEPMPTYHARDVALQRAGIENSPVIMGSATPSLESYYRALRGEFRLLELPQRVMGHARQIAQQQERLHIPPERAHAHPLGPEYAEACFIELPAVEIIDMRHELRAGNRSIFSRRLQDALRQVLERGEQAILFLNRRGMASIVSCRDCGYVVRCERCSMPMTYHEGSRLLVCHHCNHRMPAPAQCPSCGSRRIRYLGMGTERLESALQELFPGVRTLRWDRDVTGTKGAHERILDQFSAGGADVLIGTQMIAKGLDLPLVTLVGVVLADTALYLPDFRAAERTFQLLVQVAGRAGRSILGGRVIIQTYTPKNYSIQRAARHDFAGFYQEELAFREQQGYPPFCRLAALRFAHRDPGRAQAEAERVHRLLGDYLRRQGFRDVELSGPVPCFFARLRGAYRWQIILKAGDPAEVFRGFPLPAGWRLDIDPVSLL